MGGNGDLGIRGRFNEKPRPIIQKGINAVKTALGIGDKKPKPSTDSTKTK